MRKHVRMGVKVLVLAPSNVAVDRITLKIKEAGLSVVRVWNTAWASPEVEGTTFESWMEYMFWGTILHYILLRPFWQQGLSREEKRNFIVSTQLSRKHTWLPIPESVRTPVVYVPIKQNINQTLSSTTCQCTRRDTNCFATYATSKLIIRDTWMFICAPIPESVRICNICNYKAKYIGTLISTWLKFTQSIESISLFLKIFYAEKQCSRQFWNAVEREPVRLESSILPRAKRASSETT